jgi:hypothetical protein
MAFDLSPIGAVRAQPIRATNSTTTLVFRVNRGMAMLLELAGVAARYRVCRIVSHLDQPRP